MPAAAPIDVPAWPTPNVSYGLSLRLGNGVMPPHLRTECIWSRAPGEDLVRVALMPDIPDDAIVRCVVQVVKRDGELDGAEAGREMAAGLGDAVDEIPAEFPRHVAQRALGQLAEIRRSPD